MAPLAPTDYAYGRGGQRFSAERANKKRRQKKDSLGSLPGCLKLAGHILCQFCFSTLVRPALWSKVVFETTARVFSQNCAVVIHHFIRKLLLAFFLLHGNSVVTSVTGKRSIVFRMCL